jgi:O-antigen ligase
MASARRAHHRPAAESSVLTVVQDVFCLLWGAAVANAVRRRRWLLEMLLRAWVWSGVAWAGVLCFGRIAGINWMAGVTARDGGRASLTFDDPNLAANYFLVVIALLLATSVVRHALTRVLATAVLLLAIVFTGSNGAAIGLATMVGVGVLLGLRRRRGILPAAAATLLTAAGLALVVPHVDLAQIGQKAADSVQVLRDSLGRTDESSGSRQELASETLSLYLGGDLIGVGPGRTKATLKGDAAPYVKEAHNDYLATLVERGALGGVGLVLLIAVIALRLGRIATWPQTAWVRVLVPRPEYLLALGCALATAAMFYEVLHFRHLWALFGLVAGIDPGLRLEDGTARWAR